MALELVTAPATEPITASEAKSFLRVSSSAEDTFITALIVAARRYVENYTGRALVTQTWRMWLDQFPVEPRKGGGWWDGVREELISSSYATKRSLEIPKAPVSAVSSITTFADDSNETETTFASTNYIVDTVSPLPRIVLKTGSTWPVDLRAANAIKVTFTAGYGAASAVPDDIKQAMYLLIGHWFENRQEVITGTISVQVEQASQALLQPYRILRL